MPDPITPEAPRPDRVLRPFIMPLPDRGRVPAAIVVPPRVDTPPAVGESERRSGPFLMPLPDRVSPPRIESVDRKTELPSLRKHLRTIYAARNEEGVVSAEDEVRIAEQAPKLEQLIAGLDATTASEFLTNKYVRENLDMFVDVAPRKVQLSLQVAKQVQEEMAANDFLSKSDKLLMPALNLSSYTVVEMLREKGFTAGMNKKSGTVENAKKSLEDMIKGGFTKSWGEKALYRHAVSYLSKLPPELKGADMEHALISEITSDLHKKLSSATTEMSWAGQSQGIEIEVLSHITDSKRADEREIDKKKWLPRGIPKGAHSRKDWSLLPLLGVPEDIGERKHQLFEVSPSPSESAAAQATVMFSLLSGKFISEDWLSGNKASPERENREGYSLHVSSAFPKEIITDDSLKEYTLMARALAGAFATDQRISFGGFMSGGKEIADKSASGRLQEIGKRKPAHDSGLAKDESLIEIRNLDVSLRDPYSALMQKEVLDFSFRCAWEKIAHPDRPQTKLEAFAAKQWGDFQYELHDLYRKYGIAPEQLKRKYEAQDKDVNDWAWKDMAKAREDNPELKKEFAELIRKHTSAIRGEHRKETQPHREKEMVQKQTRYILSEPLGKNDELRMFVGGRKRKQLGVSIGDVITLNLGDKQVQVKVSQGMVRGDGNVEGLDSTNLRFSKKVLDSLQIGNGYAVIPKYNRETKEYSFQTPESSESPVIRIREPRKILAEPREGGDNEFYMTYDDRKQFGVKPGDTIKVRFGTLVREVTVTQSKKREDGTVETPASGNWRLSKNVASEFGVPEDYPLRARFDKDSKELRFGPSVAQLRSIKIGADGSVETTYEKGFFKQTAQQAREYGVFAVLVDPKKQNPELVKRGFVEGYITNKDGVLQKVTVPVPDVSYDKEIDTFNSELMKQFSEHIISPEQSTLTGNKWKFAQLMKESSLAAYQPDTVPLSLTDSVTASSELRSFLGKHDKVILKPLTGYRSNGIVSIEKDGSGYKVKSVGKVGGSTIAVVKDAATIDDVLEMTKKYTSNTPYIAQEKLTFAKFRRSIKKADGTTLMRNRNVEIRVIVQKGITGQPEISGTLTRLMDPEVPGREYSEDSGQVLENVFPGRLQEVTDNIAGLSKSALKVVEEKIKKSVGEIAFDIGVLEDGSLCIIEANSKAETRLMFRDANNKDAEDQSTRKSSEYVLARTDMN